MGFRRRGSNPESDGGDDKEAEAELAAYTEMLLAAATTKAVNYNGINYSGIVHHLRTRVRIVRRRTAVI